MKQSSLFCSTVSDKEKRFNALKSGINVKKLFTFVIYGKGQVS